MASERSKIVVFPYLLPVLVQFVDVLPLYYSITSPKLTSWGRYSSLRSFRNSSNIGMWGRKMKEKWCKRLLFCFELRSFPVPLWSIWVSRGSEMSECSQAEMQPSNPGTLRTERCSQEINTYLTHQPRLLLSGWGSRQGWTSGLLSLRLGETQIKSILFSFIHRNSKPLLLFHQLRKLHFSQSWLLRI